MHTRCRGTGRSAKDPGSFKRGICAYLGRALQQRSHLCGLGDKDQAFALLDQAYKDRSYYLATYLATDARMDSLRSDPRFGNSRRVGLPE